MCAKRITENQITGQRGENAAERIALEMGFLWHPSGRIEGGIDGFIETRDPGTGNLLATFIGVQSKSTQGRFPSESDETFDWSCDAADIDYWMRGNIPIILVVSRLSSGEVYWTDVRAQFSDATARSNRKLHIVKDRDVFDGSSRDALLQLATPSTVAQLTSPQTRREVLYSNLLPIRQYPDKLYCGSTSYDRPDALWRALSQAADNPPSDWVLKSGQVLSFNDLSDHAWSAVCDPGTVEDFDSAEWADSTDRDRVQDFVQLLNFTLRQDLSPLLRYERQKDLYYFSPTKNLRDKTISYRATAVRAKRSVFKAYYSKASPNGDTTNGPLYYRHSAFEGRFLRLDGQWYLQLTPTYHFTVDGSSPHPHAGAFTKGIKILEHNEAVRGQLLMWESVLAGDMLTTGNRCLEFGSIKTFDLAVGINDAAWTSVDSEAAKASGDDSVDQLPLFQDHAH
ncbi:MAG: DUF4365 domain-containing protein [Dehalococcoidia bacterium]